MLSGREEGMRGMMLDNELWLAEARPYKEPQWQIQSDQLRQTEVRELLLLRLFAGWFISWRRLNRKTGFCALCTMKERRNTQPLVVRCKLVLVGDVQCGKTAMLQVLAKDCYPEVGCVCSHATHVCGNPRTLRREMVKWQSGLRAAVETAGEKSASAADAGSLCAHFTKKCCFFSSEIWLHNNCMQLTCLLSLHICFHRLILSLKFYISHKCDALFAFVFASVSFAVNHRSTSGACEWHLPSNGSMLLIAPQTYVPTVFENYTACLELEDQRVELSLWDTSGNPPPPAPFIRLQHSRTPKTTMTCQFNELLMSSSFPSFIEIIMSFSTWHRDEAWMI